MSDVNEQANGIEPIKDDELDAVAGGAGFRKCDRGHYEAFFPKKDCKGCQYLRCFSQPVTNKFPYVMECKFFGAHEPMENNKWNFEDSWKKK